MPEKRKRIISEERKKKCGMEMNAWVDGKGSK